MSLRDNILQSSDLKIERVHVPEWGVTLYVKEMSAAEKFVWRKAEFKDGKPVDDDTDYRWLIHTLCNEDRTPIFTDLDIPALRGKSETVIRRLCTLADDLNWLSAKRVEESEKN